jgi:hypothetical protein
MPKKASKKAPMPKTYKGKSTKQGGGGHFLMVVDALMKEGMTEEQAKAIAAQQGREKYGKNKFQKMAATGLRRSLRKKKGK